MPLDKLGNGTIMLQVSSVMLIPSHTKAPTWTPENPNPEPVVIPDQAQSTLIPMTVTDPEVEAAVTGSLTILTSMPSPLTVGDKFVVTLAKEVTT